MMTPFSRVLLSMVSPSRSSDVDPSRVTVSPAVISLGARIVATGALLLITLTVRVT